MRRMMAACFLAMIMALPGVAGTKEKGDTVLKDVQPAGTTDKHNKNQQYDLTFTSTSGKEYTCRTSPKKSIKATDFVVGSNVTYEVKDNKGKIKTAAGKDLNCTIVLVSKVGATPK